jgi:hypothetical protein
MCLLPFEGVLHRRDVMAGELDASVKSVPREHFGDVGAEVSL